MELKNFNKAKEVLRAIDYAKETLKKLDEHGTTKYISVGPVTFVRHNPGAILTEKLPVYASITGFDSVYYESIQAFNDKVVAEFKTVLKAEIIKLEEKFKNL